MKVYLETMGCQMNQLDSELVEGLLRSVGHEMVADRRSADVVLYNTCSVRQHAEDKVFSRVGADAQRKASGKKLVVGVLGCVAQAVGERIRKWYPQVDIVCAPGQIHRLPELIEQAARGKAAVALDAGRKDRPDPLAASRLEEMEVHRDVEVAAATAPSPSQAFVRVMRGCDKFCTYCVVPFVRGPERSRPPHAVVEEVRRLVDAGRTQITLLGQTVNSYRWGGQNGKGGRGRAATGETPVVPGGAGEASGGGEGGPAVRFSDLLAQVSAVPGLRRLRFITSHPLDFGDDILQAMRDLPNVCPYIHCPAQSGSDAMLTRMKRGYTRSQYDDFVDRARAIVPGVILSGDFIVGFSGETEEDHVASAELIRRSGYKNCFIFKYSPREGTLAARKYADDVPEAVKKRRNKELLAVQKEVGQAHHRQLVGKTVEVLVEGPSSFAQRGLDAAAGANEAKRPGRKTGDHTPAPIAGEIGDGEIGDCPPAPSEIGDCPPAPSAGGAVPDFPRPPEQATQLVGRTTGDHIVVFDGPPNLAGRYVSVEIAAATSLTLLGRAVRSG
jgi:tRNA-2-methylthio-N6-dimethylallyladenosine synthase